MSKVVGVTGYAQHGKDTLGAELVAAGYTRYAFADALKSMALVLDPLILSDTQSGDAALRVLEPVRLSWLVGELGWEGAKQNPEVRRFLQVLGTEGVRDHLGENSWVKALEKRWLEANCPNIVVTDVRFPNEAEWIRRVGGTLIRVERPGFDNGVSIDHPSEANVRFLAADLVLKNDGTLDDWQRVCAELPVTMMVRG